MRIIRPLITCIGLVVGAFLFGSGAATMAASPGPSLTTAPVIGTAITVERPAPCERLTGGSDDPFTDWQWAHLVATHGTLDYSHGEVHVVDSGQTIGYAPTEDSALWSAPSCGTIGGAR